MPPEKFLPIEHESVPVRGFETAGDIEIRLIALGWTKEQLGDFAQAVQEVADAIAQGNEGDSARKADIGLEVMNDQNGGEEAVVTIAGEGRGLGPEEISKLIDGQKLSMKALDASTLEFFADQNKMVLRRKRNLPPETDSVQ